MAKALARDELWEIASGQHGYVTAHQAEMAGVGLVAIRNLVTRGTLEGAAFGVYRFSKYPTSEADPYMQAVLWARVPEAALSHETALAVYELSDVNPAQIDITVGKHRRIRRTDMGGYLVHRQDLASSDVGWWREVPCVRAATAITQCIESGTPTYLLRQAIDAGLAGGRITTADQAALASRLAARDVRSCSTGTLRETAHPDREAETAQLCGDAQCMDQSGRDPSRGWQT